MPIFSIVVPVYNAEQYVDKCINSILYQTFTDLELILVDDGSKDDSCSLCNAIAKNDKRVKILRQENQGASAARNNGITAAEGEYIIFLDSDDYWLHLDALDIIWKRLSKTTPDVLSFNYRKNYGTNMSKPYFSECVPMPKGLLGIDSLKYIVSHDLWVSCSWNKVIKRQFFFDNQLDFSEGVTSEDIDWCVRLALLANNFDYIPLDVVAYLQQSSSVSKTVTVSKVECLIANIKKSIDILNQSKSKSNKNTLLWPYIGYQVGTLLFTLAQLDNRVQRRKMTELVNPLLTYIQYSNNKKVTALRFTSSLIGINSTVELLRAKGRIQH